MHEVLTVIPAKLGSTRLPRKNILPLGGRPLLAWALEAARESGVCGEIMVSTESEEVAEVARAHGGLVPFMRPQELGADPYGVADVCLHVLDAYEALGRAFRTLVILLPTSPLRTARDIRDCMQVFRDENASFLMSVTEFEHNPFSALRPDQGRVMTACFPEYVGRKRHEVPRAYRQNGAVTIVDVAAFRRAGTYYGTPLHTHVMPWEGGLDIDTEGDLAFAEYLLQRRRSQQ